MSAFDPIPCPILVTDEGGKVISLNQCLLDLAGGALADWATRPMEALFPMPSRIFLQTHVWPMLMRDGRIQEIRLQLLAATGNRMPVYVNCQKTSQAGVDHYTWLFFITFERSLYEQELLAARKRTDELLAQTIENERYIRTITDGIPNMVAYWDNDLVCQFANQPYAQWFGLSPQNLFGISMATLLGAPLFKQTQPHIQAALAGKTQEFERMTPAADGSTVHSLANYIPDRDASGLVKGFFSVVTNISALRQADTAIRLSASVFEATSEGIMVTDTQSIILSVNQAFTRLTGYRSDEVVGRNAKILNSGRHNSLFFHDLYAELRASGQWKGQVWSKRKNDQVFLEELSISSIHDEAGTITHYVGVFEDITNRWDKEQQIQRMAFHDPLTDLPNRASFMLLLKQLIAIASRETRQIALLFLDLDGFKAVNDRWGHDMGDHVLKTVATRLSEQLRDADTAARLGGDEFVVLLNQADSHESVSKVAARLIAAVNAPINSHAGSLQVGTSIGIAVFRNDEQTPEQLLKEADSAMYLAKKAGKNSFSFGLAKA
ncbi:MULTISPECIES: bifunctional diguanylate cyclase/phosphodiesterase [unclassified Undibacterium]|uniref:sensor domain-containing protein n=2 Tax=Pseudomonadota TaxID=1224 RepID=UPI002AC99441|nr:MULTISPECIES: diguanylate cyclase [unclassified Undibacterium]MEB0137566.1 diguanylate cyclase [Undibacterium sp. CCC2.1]MEB0170567.1 diguanylate cyclase [Undibacterium sp. CCC1.1]MEB0174508.1 diguanylate cyclase [Undibacterium sp. CCC3.4]MEB0213695.1 diguanylate cyclase [Undibacterium sp. 5I2]WPX43860.1 diguanylate cyclase [Undibacterium sp. CCC3.4]